MKITIDRSLVEQALEALETNNQAWKHLADSGDAGFWEAEEQPFYETSVKAIVALRAALAEPQGDQQPAGIVIGFTDEGHAIVEHDGFTLEEGSVLYITPPHETQPVQEPQRKPLSEEEIQELSQQQKFDSRMKKFVRIIEAAHGIKEGT